MGVDMRNQHNGLNRVAAGHKVNLANLAPAEHVIFINRQQDKVKVYSTDGSLLYKRKEKGKIDSGFIEQIPKAFDAKGRLDWDKAEKLALDKKLNKKKK